MATKGKPTVMGGLTMMGVGAAALLAAPVLWATEVDRTAWPQQAATVTTVDVEQHSHDANPSSNHTRMVTDYALDAHFTYTVDGKLHTQSAVVGSGIPSQQEAQGDAYAMQGTQRTVWVDPADPDDAVIDPEAGHGRWKMVGLFGLMSVGVGAFTAVRAAGRAVTGG